MFYFIWHSYALIFLPVHLHLNVLFAKCFKNGCCFFCVQDVAVLAKDVQFYRDQLMEREDEIMELKAERSNTRVSYWQKLPHYILLGYI